MLFTCLISFSLPSEVSLIIGHFTDEDAEAQNGCIWWGKQANEESPEENGRLVLKQSPALL